MEPVRSPYKRYRHITKVIGDSRTHQSHAESVDINNIIRRYDNTGSLPSSTREPQYADVTGLQGDLTERINFSRDTLDAAGRDFEQKQLEDQKQKQQKQIELEEQLAQFKAAQTKQETSDPSPST